MEKLFVYIKDESNTTPFKYGIVECYNGKNITVILLDILNNTKCYMMGWSEVKMNKCVILGYFPVNDDFEEFVNYTKQCVAS